MYWTTPSGTRYQTGSPRMWRLRQSVEEIARAGISTIVTRSVGIPSSTDGFIVNPGRVHPTKCASSNNSSALRQVKMSLRASAPVMKYRSASDSSSWRSRSVSMVYVGPLRSMSTRETQNRGFEAVAMTVIRYRSSAADTCRSCFCHGWPVGTKTTSSRSNQACTSLAATRWPWWIGSKVPPMTPTRRRRVAFSAEPSDTQRVISSDHVFESSRRRSGVLATGTEREQGQHHGQQDHEHDRPDDPMVDTTHGGRRLGEPDGERGERHGAHLTVPGSASRDVPGGPAK